MMDKFVNDVAGKSGFPVSIITMIIAFITQILSGCTPAPTHAAVISGGGMLGRIILYRAVRSAGVRPLSAEGQKLIDTLVAEAATASAEDVASFLSISQGA